MERGDEIEKLKQTIREKDEIIKCYETGLNGIQEQVDKNNEKIEELIKKLEEYKER